MATHHIAKGLAALGRNGDTMLLHVQPHEVAGLQALAQANGTSLTTNPHTGLPEAFSLGGMFKSILPTLAGIGVNLIPGGQVFDPLIMGAMAGAATGALTNKNHLMGALTGGLGGYGGAGLGQGLANMGANATGEGFNASAAAIDNPAGVAQAAENNLAGTSMAPDAAPASMLDNTISGIKQIGQPGSWDAFKTGLGGADGMASTTKAAMAVGMPVAGALMGGLGPSDLGGAGAMTNPEDKYDPNASLNLNTDTKLRLYATGGSVDQGGIAGLYNTSDSSIGTLNGQENNQLSQDGYGLGRLNRMAQGGYAGYAAGGYLDASQPQINLAPMQDDTNGYAGGGPIAFAGGGEPHMPKWVDKDLMRQLEEAGFKDYNKPAAQAASKDIAGRASAEAAAKRAALARAASIRTGLAGLTGAGLMMYPRQIDPDTADREWDRRYPSDNFNNVPEGHAKGGYLDGAGDGMSDSIPATIEGKQPARLADGEFVVPADVVSHLGNGSTKAGAKNLYAMMDRVRQARTGTKKQGKQINPHKMMPA